MEIPLRGTLQHLPENTVLWYESTHLYVHNYIFKMDMLLHIYVRMRKSILNMEREVANGSPAVRGSQDRFPAFAGMLCPEENLLNHGRHVGAS